MRWFITFLLLSSLAYAQDDIQFNILVDFEHNNYTLNYEMYTESENGKVIRHYPMSSDSFLLYLIRYVAEKPASKREILLHVHGMWGGQKQNFRRAYRLLNNSYVDNASSDIAVMVSLKWPGNEFDYKTNKSRVPAIASILSDQLTSWIRQLQVMYYFSMNKNIELDLLAHSLGTELMKDYILNLNDHDLNYPLFHNSVWAASDLDWNILSDSGLSRKLSKASLANHFYFSERDLTLSVSNKLNHLDRLGRVGPEDCMKVEANFEFIDVTLIRDETNFPDLISGHSYYRSSPIVTLDMCDAFSDRLQDSGIRLLSSKCRQSYVLNPEG